MGVEQGDEAFWSVWRENPVIGRHKCPGVADCLAQVGKAG